MTLHWKKVVFKISSKYNTKNGDITIFNSIHNHSSGHIQIYTKNGWITDFKQQDIYSDPDYRFRKSSYTLYRLNK